MTAQVSPHRVQDELVKQPAPRRQPEAKNAMKRHEGEEIKSCNQCHSKLRRSTIQADAVEQFQKVGGNNQPRAQASPPLYECTWPCS